jgi:hypothetical protein
VARGTEGAESIVPEFDTGHVPGIIHPTPIPIVESLSDFKKDYA